MSICLTIDFREAPLTQGCAVNFKFQFSETIAVQMRAFNLTEEQQTGFTAFFNSFLRENPSSAVDLPVPESQRKLKTQILFLA
eukprot:Awhi_evm2s2844